MREEPDPGDVFTYEARRRWFRRRVGAAQILGHHDAEGIVCLRVLDVTGNELNTLIEFMPITVSAFRASKPGVVKRLELPVGWESRRDEWVAEWKAGRAGVFSIPIGEAVQKILETVDYFVALSRGEHVSIELAFPQRSSSNQFDAIKAFVRTDTFSTGQERT